MGATGTGISWEWGRGWSFQSPQKHQMPPVNDLVFISRWLTSGRGEMSFSKLSLEMARKGFRGWTDRGQEVNKGLAIGKCDGVMCQLG